MCIQKSSVALVHIANTCVRLCSQSTWESRDKRSRFPGELSVLQGRPVVDIESCPGMLLITNGNTKVGLIPNMRSLKPVI